MHYIIAGWMLVISLPILVIAGVRIDQYLNPLRYRVPDDNFLALHDKGHWDKLVRAGLGNDRSEAMTVAARLAAFMNEVKDLDGNVYIQRPDGSMVVVHAFDNTFGGSARLPRAADKA